MRVGNDTFFFRRSRRFDESLEFSTSAGRVRSGDGPGTGPLPPGDQQQVQPAAHIRPRHQVHQNRLRPLHQDQRAAQRGQVREATRPDRSNSCCEMS